MAGEGSEYCMGSLWFLQKGLRSLSRCRFCRSTSCVTLAKPGPSLGLLGPRGADSQILTAASQGHDGEELKNAPSAQ